MAMKCFLSNKCDSKLDTNKTKALNDQLAKCNTTAPALCNSDNVTGLNITLIGECIPKLKSYLDAYSKCLKSCECSCFTDLSLVSDSCSNFNDMETSTKDARKKCTNPSQKGSFADCRAQERKVHYYGWMWCKANCSAGMNPCFQTSISPSNNNTNQNNGTGTKTTPNKPTLKTKGTAA